MDSAKELNNSVGRGHKYRDTSTHTRIRREIRRKLYRQRYVEEDVGRQRYVEEGNDMEAKSGINSNPSLQSLLTILTH